MSSDSNQEESNMPKFTVDINEFKALHDKLKEIEKHDLEDILFIEDGKVVAIPFESIDQFRFTGLNNADFILSDFHKAAGGCNNNSWIAKIK